MYVLVDGEKVKLLRKKLLLTQAELAGRMGISREALARIECNEEKTIRIATLRQFAAVMGVSNVQAARRLRANQDKAVAGAA